MAVGKKSRVGQKSLRDLAAFNLRGQKYDEGERPKKWPNKTFFWFPIAHNSKQVTRNCFKKESDGTVQCSDFMRYSAMSHHCWHDGTAVRCP